MRILHTSDWHLGRNLYGRPLLADQRIFMQNIAAIARDRAVDVVVIAGDIYDRSIPPAEAVHALDVWLDLMADSGIPVIIIPGNHDDATRIGFGAKHMAPSGVHIVSARGAYSQPVILADEFGDVAFYALPYMDPLQWSEHFNDTEVNSHATAFQRLTDSIRAHNGSNRRCVLVAHCFVEGGEPSESERPLSIGGVETVPADCFHGFVYVALGHLHRQQTRGAPHIRYSGAPFSYSFDSIDHKPSVTVVDLDGSGQSSVESVALPRQRGLRVIEGSLDDVLARGRLDPGSDEYVLVRVLDDRAILDLGARLREVYPNFVHAERTAHAERAVVARSSARRSRLDELSLFTDFVRDVTGSAATLEERELVRQILSDLQHARVD